MRVLKVLDKDRYDLDIRCKLKLHSRKVGIGETLLLDIGDYLIGPMQVLESYSQYAVVVATDDFNYYHHRDGDNQELDSLDPVFMPEEYYESVTGSIYLDGFLRAAYYDRKGLLRVDFSVKYRSILEYFGTEMNDAGVSFHQISDGFLIDDDKVVEEIFSSCGPCMPVRYIIGYLASFIGLARVSQNSNPKPARYQFSLIEDYLEDDVVLPGFFENSQKGQKQLFSFFGSMGPISSLVDEVNAEYESEDFVVERPSISFRKETLFEIIRTMFYYAGYSPIELSSYPSVMTVVRVPSMERETICFIDKAVSEPPHCDYIIRDTGDSVEIGTAGDGGSPVFVGLFYNPWFNFGKEMSDYFEIIIKKL